MTATENGRSINVVYALDNSKRAAGFKLSEGVEVPAELGSFKFARQKSMLAATIYIADWDFSG